MRFFRPFLSASLLYLSTLSYADTIPALPEPVSNNAVAQIIYQDQPILLSFMGLGEGKEHTDVHSKVWSWSPGQAQWGQRKAVPHVLPLAGRLAAVAVGIADQAYIFGGYTVDKEHNEISAPDSYRYDFASDSYHRLADMPVAVDDAAAIVYQQRYIYLLSGWHNHGNVNLVQIYDTQTDTWQQASPIPAPGVFGQSAGIVGNTLVMCDGVKVKANLGQPRSFAASKVCMLGNIDPEQHERIHWQAMPHFAGPSLYRMAATAIADKNWIVFAGGSDNPYNYNGIGYDSHPSEPSEEIFIYDTELKTWSSAPMPAASMDHRGLLQLGDKLLIIGGMGKKQQSLSDVIQIDVNSLK